MPKRNPDERRPRSPNRRQKGTKPDKLQRSETVRRFLVDALQLDQHASWDEIDAAQKAVESALDLSVDDNESPSPRLDHFGLGFLNEDD